MSNVIGLDLSVARTGVALPDGTTASIAVRIRPHASDSDHADRLIAIASELRALILDQVIDLAVIEGYGFHSHRLARNAELGGVVRITLRAIGAEIVTVAPATLKKWATGNGRAGKDAMVAEAARRGYQPANHDEADAALLREWGMNEGGGR